MRNVVVTGGSRGLGLGIARRLTAVGYRAIAIARKETSQLKQAMDEAERARPGSFQFVPFDLAEVADIPQLVKSLRNDFGAIYGLVNNAALGSNGALALMPTPQIERRSALRRLPEVDDIAHAVEFLLGDTGKSITGTVLTVDAGNTA